MTTDSTAPGTSFEAQRAEFEATMRREGCPDTWAFQDDGTGGYHNHATEWAWIAWNRARRTAIAAEADAKLAAVCEAAQGLRVALAAVREGLGKFYPMAPREMGPVLTVIDTAIATFDRETA